MAQRTGLGKEKKKKEGRKGGKGDKKRLIGRSVDSWSLS